MVKGDSKHLVFTSRRKELLMNPLIKLLQINFLSDMEYNFLYKLYIYMYK